MSHTLSITTNNNDRTILPFSSKKRSPEAAFPQSSHDDTPPDSRPPSRSYTRPHTQKRPRFRNLSQRPAYVTEKEASIQLVHSSNLNVDVLWPGRQAMERGLLGEFLSGGRTPEGFNPGGGDAGRTLRESGFIVLCFLGGTVEHLQHLRYIVTSLLALCLWEKLKGYIMLKLYLSCFL